MVAARFRDYYDRQAKKRQCHYIEPLVESFPQGESKARDAAGKEFGVSGSSVPPTRAACVIPV